MVDFVLLNELSLPFKNDIDIEQHFREFLLLVRELKFKEIQKIRIEKDFKEFEIVQGIYFPQFLGRLRNKELKDRLRTFITNQTIKIESPLIFEDEKESEQLLVNEYFYENNSVIGALACADIWNALSISFNSNVKWNNPFVKIEKENFFSSARQQIKIRNASTKEHLNIHTDFFQELEQYIRLGVNPSNFWEKENLFKEKIIICDEVEKQVKNIDTKIFVQAISILRDLENEVKTLADFTTSGESQSVTQDFNLKKQRMFTINGTKEYFQNHIKNLSSGYRIYFFEKNRKIYIGYIGKHLPSKKFD